MSEITNTENVCCVAIIKCTSKFFYHTTFINETIKRPLTSRPMKCVCSLPVMLAQTFFYLANIDVAHYRVHITLLPGHTVSYLIPLHTVTCTIAMILFNIIFPYTFQLIFSSLLLFLFSSQFCSQTFSVYVLPLGQDIKFQTHKKTT
jgi:hypothetical protein